MNSSETPLRRALFRALHDPLTGLANRSLLMDRATQALARAKRRTSTVAVLFVDLDRFKLVNDSLGHGAGDDLLVEIAGRLEAIVRGTDLVARIGADEFVVLAEHVDGEADAVALAHRIREAVAAPVSLRGGERVVVTASVGIALGGPGHDEPAALLWDADIAMYRAKERGRDGYALFEDGLRAAAVNRFRAESLLRRALDHQGLRLQYQPIVEVASGEMVGAEALVRISDPDRGLIAPAEFIGVAEESGLVVPLGSWVVAEAAAQAARWGDPRPGSRPFTVAVNLSGRQLAHPAFLGEVAGLLDGTGLDGTGLEPEALCFELTEHALVDATGAALRSLEALKERGVRLAIDDFGTGHSSLTWLRRLPVDMVKVDRTFVAGLGRDPGDTAIVRAVVGLGQSLGLVTVAEGVETADQLEVLQELGCDWAQGYHFARPGPADVITARRAAGLNGASGAA